MVFEGVDAIEDPVMEGLFAQIMCPPQWPPSAAYISNVARLGRYRSVVQNDDRIDPSREGDSGAAQFNVDPAGR